MPLSSDDRALLAALRASIAAEAPALAAHYVERAPALGRDPAALAADAAMLGAGNALAYLRQLELARTPRRDGDRMGRRAFAVQIPFSDWVARPGVRAWVLAEDRIGELAPRSPDASVVVHVDALAPSVTLNAVVHALLVGGGKVTLVPADAAPVEVLGRALAGASSRVTVERGATASDLAKAADSVTVIAPSAARAAIVEAVGPERSVAGYVTDAPATYVILPAYYDRAELRQMVRSVAADLRASPSGSTDVEIAICRTWEQRAFFRELLANELGGEFPAERRVARGSNETPAARPPGLSIAVLDTDVPSELPVLASAFLTSATNPAHAVAAFAHPLDLENPERARAVDDLLASTSARSVAINARPTLAYLLGAVPFGPRGQGIQNAARVDGDERVVIEAAFHLAPCEARGWARARDRYDHAPTFPRAVGLALRAIF